MMPSPPDPIAHLRLERRSYILGTLLVWGVVLAASVVLFINMEPKVFAGPPAMTVSQAMARITPLTSEQQFLLQLVNLVGGVALFFLNLRFSLLILRPRWAYVSSDGQVKYASGRWGWWAILALNSLFYLSLFLLPQLILTAVLAHWGSVEIQLRQERMRHPPPPHDAEPPALPL
jgi:hypothetical protein